MCNKVTTIWLEIDRWFYILNSSKIKGENMQQVFSYKDLEQDAILLLLSKNIIYNLTKTEVR